MAVGGEHEQQNDDHGGGRSSPVAHDEVVGQRPAVGDEVVDEAEGAGRASLEADDHVGDARSRSTFRRRDAGSFAVEVPASRSSTGAATDTCQRDELRPIDISPSQ